MTPQERKQIAEALREAMRRGHSFGCEQTYGRDDCDCIRGRLEAALTILTQPEPCCPKCGGTRFRLQPSSSQWEDESVVCRKCGYSVEHDIVSGADDKSGFSALKRLALAQQETPSPVERGGCMADWGPGEEEEWERKTANMTEEQKHEEGLKNLRALFQEKRDQEG